MYGDGVMFGQCYLCDTQGRPPVAVCCRCGTFVCREHIFRLVHRAPRRPMAIAAPPSGSMTRLELVCEVCYLSELAALENVRKRAV